MPRVTPERNSNPARCLKRSESKSMDSTAESVCWRPTPCRDFAEYSVSTTRSYHIMDKQRPRDFVKLTCSARISVLAEAFADSWP